LFAARRYYQPSLGRFLTKDLAAPSLNNSQALNQYVYSLNNPIILIDPSGLSGQKDGQVLGASTASSDEWNGFLTRLGGAVRQTLFVDTVNFIGCGFSLGQATNACRKSIDPDNANPE